MMDIMQAIIGGKKLPRMISLTVTLDIEEYHLIEEWAQSYHQTFSQALRTFIQKGKAHELERLAKADSVDKGSTDIQTVG